MRYLIPLLLILGSDLSSAAFDPETVMFEIDRKQTGFSSFKARLEIRHSSDDKSGAVKHIDVYASENADDGQYRLFSFTAPRSANGTSLLFN